MFKEYTLTPVDWDVWCGRYAGDANSEPCDHPDPLECSCGGMCICHWVAVPAPSAEDLEQLYGPLWLPGEP